MVKVCWFSAGVSSFIAAYLVRETLDQIIYCHIEDQHYDTMRFLGDCENKLGNKFKILQSRYKSVGNVIRQFRYINGAHGAKCTDVLKRRVRKEWERGKKDLIYVWGYDCNEKHRAEQIQQLMPEHQHIFPLIDHMLIKEDCHGILRKLGMKRPAMYNMGYKNNNCRGCVKGGMGYWNKIREDFPEVFKERAEQEREIGHTCINGIYLDELDPGRGDFEKEIMDECGFLCQIYTQGTA